MLFNIHLHFLLLLQSTAMRYEVNAMPTFLFFRNREKVHQVLNVLMLRLLFVLYSTYKYRIHDEHDQIIVFVPIYSRWCINQSIHCTRKYRTPLHYVHTTHRWAHVILNMKITLQVLVVYGCLIRSVMVYVNVIARNYI